MSDDLISRSALKAVINEYIDEYSALDNQGYHCEKWCAMKEAEMAIDNAPPAVKDLRLENEGILRRLKHLLESEYISQFDQVDPNTNEYIRNIKEADWKVAYLCDQNKSCNIKCTKDHLCKRTCDISHAKNFRLVPNGIYPIMFEEVDEHCIANFSFDREQLQKIVDERVIEPIKNGELVIKKEERPHGEWLELETNPPDFFGHRFYSCSICGREIDVMTPEESLHDYPYCHCGASMIKEEKNE